MSDAEFIGISTIEASSHINCLPLLAPSWVRRFMATLEADRRSLGAAKPNGQKANRRPKAMTETGSDDGDPESELLAQKDWTESIFRHPNHPDIFRVDLAGENDPRDPA
jgi:hypothetical protein